MVEFIRIWHKTIFKDRFGCFEHYDKSLFWKDKAEKQKSAQTIKTKDVKGEFLRKIEKEVYQYLQEWHKKNSRFNSENKDLFEKIMVALIGIFNNQQLFVKRQQEANSYLQLVQEAMNGIPAGFFKGLEKRLNESDWGPVNGSRLHKMMYNYFITIQVNKDYRILVNPSSELFERMKELEEKSQQRELQIQQELQWLNENHQRALREQREAIEGNVEVRIKAQTQLLQDQLIAMSEENNTLKAQQQVLGQENNTLKTQQQVLGQENNTLKAQQQVLGQENNTLKAQQQVLGQENNTLKAQQQVLGQENNTLKAQQQVLGQENNTLKAQQQVLGQENNTLKAQQQAMQAKMEEQEQAMSEENNALKAQQQAMQAKMEKQEQAMKTQMELIMARLSQMEHREAPQSTAAPEEQKHHSPGFF